MLRKHSKNNVFLLRATVGVLEVYQGYIAKITTGILVMGWQTENYKSFFRRNHDSGRGDRWCRFPVGNSGIPTGKYN